MFDDGGMAEISDPSRDGGPVDQSVSQEIFVEINVLTFVFSGSFAQNAFQDAGFHFANIQIDVDLTALNSASLYAADSDAGDGALARQSADQRTDTQVNLLQFVFTGDVRDNALDGLAFYFDGVYTDVQVVTANDADLTATIQSIGLPGSTGYGGADQSVDQRVHAEVNVLTFEFSGVFDGDAFREADFYFADLWVGPRVDAANNASLSATAAEGSAGQAVSQATGAAFRDWNFEFDGIYGGDAFRDADMRFEGIRVEALIDVVNDIALVAPGVVGHEVGGPSLPLDAEAGAPSNDPALVWA